MSSIDHLTIRVTDLGPAASFYRSVFELLQLATPSEGGGFVEWNDFSIAEAIPGRPPTRRLHVGFAAQSRDQVDDWWQALTAAGYRDDGAPGPRSRYGVDYYGAFVLDPDGNSVEAVHNPPRRNETGVIDHVWFRYRDLEGARDFFAAIAPVVGLEVRDLAERAHFRTTGATFSLVAGPPTEHAHLAFGVGDRAAVRRFHHTALEAGAEDNGGPGERPEYHAGYYGAYVLDPGGNNIEAVFHER